MDMVLINCVVLDFVHSLFYVHFLFAFHPVQWSVYFIYPPPDLENKLNNFDNFIFRTFLIKYRNRYILNRTNGFINRANDFQNRENYSI